MPGSHPSLARRPLGNWGQLVVHVTVPVKGAGLDLPILVAHTAAYARMRRIERNAVSELRDIAERVVMETQSERNPESNQAKVEGHIRRDRKSVV